MAKKKSRRSAKKGRAATSVPPQGGAGIIGPAGSKVSSPPAAPRIPTLRGVALHVGEAVIAAIKAMTPYKSPGLLLPATRRESTRDISTVVVVVEIPDHAVARDLRPLLEQVADEALLEHTQAHDDHARLIAMPCLNGKAWSYRLEIYRRRLASG